MLANDKRISKLAEKAEILENRINADTDELKKIQTEIKVLSYDNLEIELSKNDLTTEDYVFFARIKKKLEEKNIPFDEFEKIVNGLAKKF